jgi:hypothetical protein
VIGTHVLLRVIPKLVVVVTLDDHAAHTVDLLHPDEA